MFYFFYWYSKRLSCYQPVLAPWETESISSIRSCARSHTLLSGAVNVSSVPGFCCSSLLSHRSKSMPPSHLFSTQWAPCSCTSQQYCWAVQVLRAVYKWGGTSCVSLLLEKRAGCPQTFPKASFSPVPAGGNYCLQFQYITKVLKRLEGEEPKALPDCYPPLWKLCRYPKGVKKQAGKTWLFKSILIQILKLAGNWPRGLFKCPSKNGIKNLGAKTGILSIRSKYCLFQPHFKPRAVRNFSYGQKRKTGLWPLMTTRFIARKQL